MPKKDGFLYEKMCDRELILEIIRTGTRGKRKRWDVKKVVADPEGYADKLLKMLEDDGSLTVLTADGQSHRVFSGEVSVRPI